ncbi:MAG: metallophosphatase, partial [Muribaculaceae bacterium]|nr:metallophosphatase [Muribaculaceae bacterium]
MNDYAQILYNKHRLIPQNINDEFERNFAFIKQAVRESNAEKIVVVTHHLPTFAAIEDRHKGNVLNDANAT